ncbi:MAG: hypothetical protein ACXW5U_12010 [Thermoanaerobaculia bacterium]
MKITIALCLLIASSPLFAQYGPPAKDLDEALFFMKEIQRQLEPAVAEARERAVVFKLVGNVQNKLIGNGAARHAAARAPAERVGHVRDALREAGLQRRHVGGDGGIERARSMIPAPPAL